MTIKRFLTKIYAGIVANKTKKWSSNPVKTQEKVLQNLIKTAKSTKFGKNHNFDKIKTIADFQSNVPVKDYEGLKIYVDEVVAGKEDILWPGKPLYFAKTSGTTSGSKYIPLTKESMPNHINAAKNALLLYANETGNTEFVDGKMIFLQGSPELTMQNGINIGRLSGITAHFVPSYLQSNRMPSWETNMINDWEEKVDAIVDETINEDMRLISGIPPWMVMYFEKLVEKSGKNIGDLFPKFSLFINGGVAYEPYRKKFDELIGRQIDVLELYPASEGFIAFQDSQKEDGMLLLLDNGMFYEFIKATEFYNENPKRHTIGDVELGINYVLILNTNAGLWGYNIGDTIVFTSTKPYRIKVSGRIKHFISAFGEHVIAKEVEDSIMQTVKNTNIKINEFTVAPQINPKSGLPYHEWFIEFENQPENIEGFAKLINNNLCNFNSYYNDLITGSVLKNLEIRVVEKNGFNNYMKSIGKLGGQNKTPRLANNRDIADKLISLNLC
ncbi:MAG: GH3 auxin-responsive promoter family protein [Ichthyobacteriaceae bacterium]|nr:GH3 auxin-responsive promoter family protein [Ichthyobacteriaceae bacterium]